MDMPIDFLIEAICSRPDFNWEHYELWKLQNLGGSIMEYGNYLEETVESERERLGFNAN